MSYLHRYRKLTNHLKTHNSLFNIHIRTVLRTERSCGAKKRQRGGGAHLILQSQLVTPWCLKLRDMRHSSPSKRVCLCFSLSLFVHSWEHLPWQIHFNISEFVLLILPSAHRSLVTELLSLPLKADNLSLRSRRAQLDCRLSEVEEAIKIFSRDKVYVKVDS